jgi:prephenate dehydratase
LPCRTFEDAFNAVESGEAALGMIPIENTIAGRVADIHYLLPESKLHIIGEYFMPIHFQLMAIPGATMDGIQSVHSHIHALGQCRNIVRDRGWRPVVAGDTAGAARQVAEAKDPTMACFSPRLAAELYGLDILEENVEDSDSNVTRFVVLSPENDWAERQSQDDLVVTTFVFNVRNLPAALYKAMGGFATNGVNMTKLESYQLEGKFTATQFYADIEGHPEDPGVARALEELQFFSTKVRILGAYKAHPFRTEQARE